jgi:hypothetical protein
VIQRGDELVVGADLIDDIFALDRSKRSLNSLFATLYTSPMLRTRGEPVARGELNAG